MKKLQSRPGQLTGFEVRENRFFGVCSQEEKPYVSLAEVLRRMVRSATKDIADPNQLDAAAQRAINHLYDLVKAMQAHHQFEAPLLPVEELPTIHHVSEAIGTSRTIEPVNERLCHMLKGLIPDRLDHADQLKEIALMVTQELCAELRRAAGPLVPTRVDGVNSAPSTGSGSQRVKIWR